MQGVSAQGDRGHLAVDGVSLTVRAGEIVGIAGVAGNGQAELAEVIAGIRPAVHGRVRLDGRDITNESSRRIRDSGFAYIPEDRLRQGLVPAFTVVDNAILTCYARPPVSGGFLLRPKSARQHAQRLIDAFSIRAHLDNSLRSLSGGNQQRLLVSREVAQQPTLLVAVHPTAGLDIASIDAVHRIILKLRPRGVAVLLISENLDEILALSDRVVVMYRGRIVGERPATRVNIDEIGLLMTGMSAERI
jgi:simple sugar transport system ATP-binding protein